MSNTEIDFYESGQKHLNAQAKYQLKAQIAHNSIGDLDIKNINWGENKYYNNKELNNVFDAFHISKHVKNQDEIRKNSKEKHNDINNFSEQNKKNFINNFLYSMLKDERKKIADLEAEKIEALNNKINDFNIDLELFDEFKERVNEYTKKKEEILNFLFIENKKIYDNKKKISQENEILLDLIEKLIRQIINMKKYAIFTHKLLGGKSPILNFSHSILNSLIQLYPKRSIIL